ncbi:hypothetical protein K8I61_08930 [bacterium]|nr:hypothetical protein [bacterium]
MTRRNKRGALAILAVATLAALVAWWPAPDLRHLDELGYFSERARPSGSEMVEIAGALRRIVADPAAEVATPVVDIPRTQIFVSLFAPGVDPVFVQSEPGPWDAAFREAAAKLRVSEAVAARFRPIADRCAIKVDLLHQRKKLRVRDEPRRMALEAGLDGVILQLPDRLVMLPPWDILTGDWEVAEGGNRAHRRNTRWLSRLSKAAGRGSNGWRNANLYRFRTRAFIQDAAGAPPRRLYRGLDPQKGDPRPAELREALSEAAHFVRRLMEDDGRFTYIYEPIPDETNLSFYYGVVRHAATVYGLYEANEVLNDPAIGAAADSSLAYMVSISREPLFGEGLESVRQNGLSFLGATALGLLSLLETPEATPEDEARMARYAKFLVAMNAPSGGSYGSWAQRLVRWEPDPPVLYFPGESLLALVRYYERARDPSLLDEAKKMARFQIADFRKRDVPDAWLTQALSRLARLDPDPQWRTACFELADWYVKHQHGGGRKVRYRDEWGGFDNSRPPRATPASARTEALAAAFDLAHAAGETARADQYGDAVLRACRFIMNCQYGPRIDYLARDPGRARGGIRGGLVDNDVRVDFNQHAMIAFLGGLRVLEARGERQVFSTEHRGHEGDTEDTEER